MVTTQRTVCNLCESPGALATASQIAEIRSNVRAFAAERFAMWRCDNCGSLHSRDVIDLTTYYQGYPYQQQRLDLWWRGVLGKQIGRLRRAGLQPGHSVLDYGCGSGLLLEMLRRKGYPDVAGYDAYEERFADRSVLARTYDLVMLQDVIEHVEDPGALLDEIIALVKPGGMICLGTPNADALDILSSDPNVHPLHQPYHLHIFSAGALRRLIESRGLVIERCYDVHCSDTFRPFANMRFYYHYFRLADDTMDVAFDRIHWGLGLFSPKTLALAFLGRYWPPHTELQWILRKPHTFLDSRRAHRHKVHQCDAPASPRPQRPL